MNYSAPRRNSYEMKNLHVRYRLLPYKLLVMEAPEAPKTRRLFPVLLALNRARQEVFIATDITLFSYRTEKNQS